MRNLALIGLCGAVLVACGTDAGAEGSTGCDGESVVPGEYEGVNVVGGIEQEYWIVVPDSYEQATPAPLYLHLAAGNGDEDGFLAAWRPYLDVLDGLMVMVSTQHAGEGNVETIESLIDGVGDEYCVDRDRIHAIGTSWSSSMVATLACEAADRVASFAGV